MDHRKRKIYTYTTSKFGLVLRSGLVFWKLYAAKFIRFEWNLVYELYRCVRSGLKKIRSMWPHFAILRWENYHFCVKWILIWLGMVNKETKTWTDRRYRRLYKRLFISNWNWLIFMLEKKNIHIYHFEIRLGFR